MDFPFQCVKNTEKRLHLCGNISRCVVRKMQMAVANDDSKRLCYECGTIPLFCDQQGVCLLFDGEIKQAFFLEMRWELYKNQTNAHICVMECYAFLANTIWLFKKQCYTWDPKRDLFLILWKIGFKPERSIELPPTRASVYPKSTQLHYWFEIRDRRNHNRLLMFVGRLEPVTL